MLGFLAVVLAQDSFASEGTAWFHDFDKGRAIALEQGKPMLIVFTGSDWCQWCQKLDAALLSQDAFVDELSNLAVMVELDFPRRKKLPIRQQRVNRMVFEKLGIKSFPTVLLYDPMEEHEHWRHGYRAVETEEYLDWLKGSF